MSKSKFIGKRICVDEHKDAMTITIASTITKVQQISLEMWLGAWTGLGVLMGYGAYTFLGDERIFYLGGFVFWAFFWIRIAKVVAWRRIGKEIITISRNKLIIKNAFGEKGRERTFVIPEMGEVGYQENNSTSFLQSLDNSYWILGGDTLHFKYEGKIHVFGKQLPNHDSAQLANVANKSMKKHTDKV